MTLLDRCRGTWFFWNFQNHDFRLYLIQFGSVDSQGSIKGRRKFLQSAATSMAISPFRQFNRIVFRVSKMAKFDFV